MNISFRMNNQHILPDCVEKTKLSFPHNDTIAEYQRIIHPSPNEAIFNSIFQLSLENNKSLFLFQLTEQITISDCE